MPKTRAGSKKEGFSISLSPQALALIEQLIEVGLHGTNRAEVVRSLVNDRLEELLGSGVIKSP